MTDRLPRRSRWGTVALVAPAAAALLAAATTWAAGHDPSSAVGSPASVADPAGVSVTAAPGGDSPEAALARARLADDTARLAALEQSVVGLRSQLAALGSGSGAGPGSAPTRAAVAGRAAGAPTVRTAPRPAAPRAVPRAAAPPRVVSAGS
jgi:hypothetical protein